MSLQLQFQLGDFPGPPSLGLFHAFHPSFPARPALGTWWERWAPAFVPELLINWRGRRGSGGTRLLWLPAASHSACKCDLWPQPPLRRNFHSSRRRQNSGSQDVKGYLIQGGWSGGLFWGKENPSALQWGNRCKVFKFHAFSRAAMVSLNLFSLALVRGLCTAVGVWSLAVGRGIKVTQNCSCASAFTARKF